MHSHKLFRSFVPVNMILAFVLFTTPALAQRTKALPQASASIHAVSAGGAEVASEGRREILLEEQLRVQRDELLLLKDRVMALEALVESMKAAKSEQPATSALAASPHEEATPVAPASGPAAKSSFEPQRELLPDIGQIGSEYGLLLGGSTNPFRADRGSFFGGFIDLPLKKIPVPGGKFSYEIMIGLQRSVTENRPVTSGVFALVNFALCGSLSGPSCPLPITIITEQRMKVLTVVPFSLKYSVTKFDRHRFRPYGVVGWGTYVTISSQNTTKGIGTTDPLLNSILNGSLIGGLAPEAPELRALGVPNGQGDIRFGVNFGGGFEYRVTHKFSLGFEYRGNRVEGKNGFFSSFAAKPTFHF